MATSDPSHKTNAAQAITQPTHISLTQPNGQDFQYKTQSKT
ncbi:MAG: hypothetical protein ACRC8A_10135 [Microcoleaceae cyanobacterium]